MEAICADIGVFLAAHGKDYTVIPNREAAGGDRILGARRPAVVLLAGCRQQVRASATWVSIAAVFRCPMKASAAFLPPFTPKLTTPQEPFGRYFFAVS